MSINTPELNELIDLMERTGEHEAWGVAHRAKLDAIDRADIAILNLEAAREQLDVAIKEARRQRQRVLDESSNFGLALKEAEYRRRTREGLAKLDAKQQRKREEAP